MRIKKNCIADICFQRIETTETENPAKISLKNC